MRQLGIKLILGHQSLAQLKRGDLDLTTMIFQAQSRMIFGVQGDDADVLAHELASLHFDPRRIKDEVYSRRQRISGHRITELQSWAQADAHAENWNRTYGNNWTKGVTNRDSVKLTEQESAGGSDGSGEGGGLTRTSTAGRREQLVPVHEDYWELVNRVYWTFDEDRHVWARDIRKLTKGFANVRLVDESESALVHVKQSAPGHLAFTPQQLADFYPQVNDDVERLKDQNFAAEWFVSPATIVRETELRLERILQPVITVHGGIGQATESSPETNPFA